MSKEIYRGGESIPESGIYRVSHAEHRLPHEVTLLNGQRFPRCEKCRELVEFELEKGLPQIISGADFRVILFTLPVIEDDGEVAA